MAVAISLIFVTMGCKEDKNVTGVTLDKATLTLTVGKTETLKETVLPSDAKNKAVTWASSNQAVATVVNGKVTAVKEGTATITVTTTDGGFTATCAVTVTTTNEPDPDPEWIEIAGIKWATRNVAAPGTFAAKPENAGMFYQWNRKIGWSNTDPMTNSNGGTTWDTSYPYSFIERAWEAVNDPCPSGWRVPTHEEQQSLVNSGIGEWTTLNGVNGRFFGNGNQKVFFPAVGFRSDTDGRLVSVSSSGVYWSSMLIPDLDGNSLAYRLRINSVAVETNDMSIRAGYSVRCVKE